MQCGRFASGKYGLPADGGMQKNKKGAGDSSHRSRMHETRSVSSAFPRKAWEREK
ncbi:Uncharacterized protein dnm_054610 [Desulfonema magnum]|uniref:Uncharacterized protein n=1 Tax=Desulfonema magnum TaxID=45655 RepID=A0A975BPT3_9BACT|nr:Uncharacterized protein dnm_054610 [Desulfonema magnum]